MALFSLHCSPVGRGQKKSSAVEAAAYQARETIYDRVTGKTYSASPNKYGLCIFADILAPYGAPIWAGAKDRKEIWSQAEEIDTRINSRFAKSYILALPHELNVLENQLLLKRFLIKKFLSRGLLVDYAIHVASKEGDQRNIHAHILVSTRTITTKMGFGGKDREIDKKIFLKELREDWANAINDALAEANHKETVSHLSLEAQGIKNTPQQHQGQAATAMQRKGDEPYRQRYKRNEWGDITPLIRVPVAKNIIAAMPEGEFKDLLFKAVKSASEKQAEPKNIIPPPVTIKPEENLDIIQIEHTNIISPPATVKPEENEEIIQIYVPTTKKQTVKLMIEEMDKSLNKKNQSILSIKENNDEKLELQGEFSGLRQVKVKCDEFYKNMKNDLRPFALLSEQIEQDINGKMNQNKNPTSILKGLLRGLTEGRTFIEKLLSRNFTDDEYTPDIPPVTQIDETRTNSQGLNDTEGKGWK